MSNTDRTPRANLSAGSNRFQRSGTIRARWRGRAAALILMLFAGTSLAHDALREFVQQLFVISATPQDIDIQAKFTFHEEASLAERRRMDANHDGQITRAEIRKYVEHLTPLLEETARLASADTSFPLGLLHPPELDLESISTVTAAHHTLRFTWFMRVPPELMDGTQLTLEHRLWTNVPVVPLLQVEPGCAQIAPTDRQKLRLTYHRPEKRSPAPTDGPLPRL